MKSCLLFLFLSLAIWSCTSSADLSEDGDGDQETIDLLAPCAEASVTLSLPDALEDANNYAQYEQTALIFATTQLGNQFRTSLSSFLFPPVSAVRYESDGIIVTSNQDAVTWTIDDEQYIYVRNDNGYQIYYKAPDSPSGKEIIFVDQSDDCSSFRMIQYAGQPGDPVDEGILFSYSYDQIGLGHRVAFGTDLYDSNSEEYVLRQYEDLSGDLTISEGALQQSMTWNSIGDGCYTIMNNGTEIEQGCWTF